MYQFKEEIWQETDVIQVKHYRLMIKLPLQPVQLHGRRKNWKSDFVINSESAIKKLQDGAIRSNITVEKTGG